MQRLKEKYEKEVKRHLSEEFGIKNLLDVPVITKIVVAIGAGDIERNQAVKDSLVTAIAQITGQKPKITRARISVASFNVRAGMEVGFLVTLRKERMYAFLDRLISVVLPRLRDFRGVSAKSFDSRGNVTLGFTEVSIFPEIDTAHFNLAKGFEVTVVVGRSDREKSRRLLELLGMPFQKL